MDGLCETVCRKGRYEERGTVEHDLREIHLETGDQERSRQNRVVSDFEKFQTNQNIGLAQYAATKTGGVDINGRRSTCCKQLCIIVFM